MDHAWLDKVSIVYIVHSSVSDMKWVARRYIDDTLKKDYATFKPVPTVNPFMSNFSTDTMDGAGGDDDGDAPAPGAIGSMQGIVGIL